MFGGSRNVGPKVTEILAKGPGFFRAAPAVIEKVEETVLEKTENTINAVGRFLKNPAVVEHGITGGVSAFEGYKQNGWKGAGIGFGMSFFGSYAGSATAKIFGNNVFKLGTKYAFNATALGLQSYLNTGEVDPYEVLIDAGIDMGGEVLTNFGSIKRMLSEPISRMQALVSSSNAILVSESGKLMVENILEPKSYTYYQR